MYGMSGSNYVGSAGVGVGNPRHVACICLGEKLASSPRGSQCSFSNVQKDIEKFRLFD